MFAERHGEISLRVWCPHCATYHYHGRGGYGPEHTGDGPRAAHCHSEEGQQAFPHGYVLKVADWRHA